MGDVAPPAAPVGKKEKAPAEQKGAKGAAVAVAPASVAPSALRLAILAELVHAPPAAEVSDQLCVDVVRHCAAQRGDAGGPGPSASPAHALWLELLDVDLRTASPADALQAAFAAVPPALLAELARVTFAERKWQR